MSMKLGILIYFSSLREIWDAIIEKFAWKSLIFHDTHLWQICQIRQIFKMDLFFLLFFVSIIWQCTYNLGSTENIK